MNEMFRTHAQQFRCMQEGFTDGLLNPNSPEKRRRESDRGCFGAAQDILHVLATCASGVADDAKGKIGGQGVNTVHKPRLGFAPVAEQGPQASKVAPTLPPAHHTRAIGPAAYFRRFVRRSGSKPKKPARMPAVHYRNRGVVLPVDADSDGPSAYQPTHTPAGCRPSIGGPACTGAAPGGLRRGGNPALELARAGDRALQRASPPEHLRRNLGRRRVCCILVWQGGWEWSRFAWRPSCAARTWRWCARGARQRLDGC